MAPSLFPMPIRPLPCNGFAMRNNELTSESASRVALVPGGPVHGSVRPPGSKSLTNRALICAAFATGSSRLSGALQSEDTEVMIESLRQIGLTIDVLDRGRTLEIQGHDENQSSTGPRHELFIANSGTTVRFLTAALSAFGGQYRLSGVPRMHERPIGDLIHAIRDVLDGTIETESDNLCPPVTIDSNGWSGNRISVAGNVSSQFLSGLMMAAPIQSKGGTTADLLISVDGELVSQPYVDMTAAVMQSFGANVSTRQGANLQYVIQRNEGYVGREYDIEPDASAASYFWATAAITGGKITVEGLNRNALQGDVGFCDVLAKMGCEVDDQDQAITVTGKRLCGVDVNMNAISDTVQTIAVVALFADGPTRVRGVAHNRFKETDRIGDLARELRKLGAVIDEHDDGLTIHPITEHPAAATLETYHDHRMAMSLSLAGLRMDNVNILDPSCTAKTYPHFFADMEQLLGRPHHWS